MKATLEFSLPEEQEEFQMASTAADAYSALIDLETWLRAKRKWGEEDDSATQAFADCEKRLLSCLEEHGIVLY